MSLLRNISVTSVVLLRINNITNKRVFLPFDCKILVMRNPDQKLSAIWFVLFLSEGIILRMVFPK